jgi:glycosyltransferase involved in cell wall biosynthesis
MIDVSVVVPVYKPKEAYFIECISSVLSQVGVNFELIIVDDGNVDKSYLANEILDDPRVTVHLMTQNMGQPAALNMGISLCKGKYVALLDADDIFYPDKLRKQFAYLESSPEIGMIYGHIVIKHGDRPVDEVRQVARPLFEVPRDLARLYIGNYIARSSVMVRKDVLSIVGLQDEHIDDVLPGGDDWDYWLRLVQHTSIAEYPREDPLIIYRKHQNNISDRGAQTYAFEKKCRKKALLHPHMSLGFFALKCLFLPRALLEFKIANWPAVAAKYQVLHIEKIISMIEYPLAWLITTVFGLNGRVHECNKNRDRNF